MPAPLYFAYGMNLDPEGMRKRAPGSRLVGPALLRGFRRAFTVRSPRLGALADILPQPGEVVYGLLYRLGEGDLERLDRFEGYPHLYTRFTVTVETREGRRWPGVWVYAIRPAKREGDFPPGGPYRRVLEDYRARWGLPPDPLTLPILPEEA